MKITQPGSQTQIALIRGINVGKAKRIAMADLRSMFNDLGYIGVRTVLNSGNVLFKSSSDSPARSASRIEDAISGELGVTARVLVFDTDTFNTVVAQNPFGETADNPSRLLVCFVDSAPELKKLDPLLQTDWGTDQFAVGSFACYMWCAEGILSSQLPDAVGRLLKNSATTRNWRTVLKLQDLVATSN